jgi:hypothetical protein
MHFTNKTLLPVHVSVLFLASKGFFFLIFNLCGHPCIVQGLHSHGMQCNVAVCPFFSHVLVGSDDCCFCVVFKCCSFFRGEILK